MGNSLGPERILDRLEPSHLDVPILDGQGLGGRKLDYGRAAAGVVFKF
jgi:hypothetical protein